MKAEPKGARRLNILLGVGATLIALAVCITVYNLVTDFRAGESADAALEKLIDSIPQTPPAVSYKTVPEMEMPVTEIDGNDYIGWLDMPSIGIQLPVMADWRNGDLSKAPCRYKGSAYDNTLVIAGRNYSSHFGQLPDLREGDAISFTDADGNVFTYEVESLGQVGTADLEDFDFSGSDMTLMTQSLSGQYQITISCRLA